MNNKKYVNTVKSRYSMNPEIIPEKQVVLKRKVLKNCEMMKNVPRKKVKTC